MIFPLRGFRSPTAVPSLAGGTIRYKPVIPITIIGPRGQLSQQTILDTGSDDVAFPTALASSLGVDLTSATQRYAQGVGSAQPLRLQFAPVILLLSDGTEVCRWRAVVGFTQARLLFPLFGIAGGLEHFQTTLNFALREVTLSPQPSLPATQDPVP